MPDSESLSQELDRLYKLDQDHEEAELERRLERHIEEYGREPQEPKGVDWMMGKPTMSPQQMVQRIAELKIQEEDLDEKLKAVSLERKELEKKAADAFIKDGMASTRLQNGIGGELHHYLYLSKRGEFSTEDFIRELRAAGWGEFVYETYSPSSMKALVKEKLAERPAGTKPEEVIPERLRPMVSVYEEARVIATGSAVLRGCGDLTIGG